MNVINHEMFVRAIQERKVVKIKFYSIQEGTITRKCVPFDYGPCSCDEYEGCKYHFEDIAKPDGPHVLLIFPIQLMEIKVLSETFDPGKYVTWSTKWSIERDWGKFS